MGPELIIEVSNYDQTLMQGSSKLNRRHRSNDSGRGNDCGGSALMMCKVTLDTAVRKAEASGGSTGMQGTAGLQGRRH